MYKNRNNRLFFPFLLSLFLNLFFVLHPTIQSIQKSQQSKKIPLIYSETIEETLLDLLEKPYEALIACLENQNHIEQGQKINALALAVLVHKHYFNLEKALFPNQVKTVWKELPNKEIIGLYPNLQEKEWSAIFAFIQEEFYPLTSQGQFALLKNMGNPPRTLLKSCETSEEFVTLDRTFRRIQHPQKTEDLLQLIAMMPWETVSSLVEEIKRSEDGISLKWGQFLIHGINNGSHIAAKLLIDIDYEYAIKKINDTEMKDLLTLLPRQIEQGTKLRRSLQNDLQDHLLDEETIANQKHNQEEHTEPYTIKNGDSLWKIAKEQKTSIQRIQELNHMTSDKLIPGQTLLLPSKENKIGVEK